jgi:hypothetical protein
MMALRHGLGMAVDLVRYVWGTGRWWIGVLIPGLAIASALIAAAKLAVPTIVYAFF